jgi:3-oxoacyl-[acyl-carrier protein] reductase
MAEEMTLAGKTIFISGGSRGIGLAIVKRAAVDGANVAIAAKTVEPNPKLPGTIYSAAEEIEAAGGKALALACDIRDEQQVVAAARKTAETFGGIDILINNAGIGRMGEVSDQTTADWRLMIETNLTGVFFCCRAVIPHMKLREGGWIINISSLASQNPFAGGAAYSATKAGLNAFSHALMQEVRQAGIRVSVVLPGSVDTRFSDRDTGPTDWKLSPDDVARTVIDLLGHPGRSLPSRVELRPSRPKS